MSFREKSAWISFVSMLAFGAAWLWTIIRHEIYGPRPGNPLHVFLVQLALLLLLEVGLHVAIAIQSPREARTPKDERERLIDLKASRVAFYALLTGAFLTIWLGLHLHGATRFFMGQVMMGSIITTLLIRFATQIALHRRDA